MRRCPFLRPVAILTAASLVASCATTNVPPISSAGSDFEPERDERRLWERSREEENKLLGEARIYPDPLLTDYLERVVQRLNPPAMAANPSVSYRVRVLEEPTLNAFAYPHGSLYVHTGLLARMENEDQLAAVLGHEMSHVEDRHMLRHERSLRNKQIGFTLAAVAGAVVAASEEGHAIEEGKFGKAARTRVLSDLLLGLGLTLAVVASVNGYGRKLEREADAQGFEKMVAAGYDIAEAPKVYQALLEDYGEPSKAEAFFFGSHPRLTERIESAREWASAHPEEAGGHRAGDDAEFGRRLRPVIRDDARLNLEMGRLQRAEQELDRALGLMPEDPQTHFLVGRLRLAQAAKEKGPAERRLLEEARASFREAIRLDPKLPGPHREAGLLAHREGDLATACVEFRQYLELDPRAEDVQSIRDYRLELERGGHCP